jgi:hypothetical protein
MTLAYINKKLVTKQIQAGGVLRCVFCNGIAKEVLGLEVT